MTANTTDFPVIIVGAGPVGLLAAVLLAQLRLPVALIEKKQWPSHLPKARNLTSRTMEIFRQLGIESDIRRAGLPAQEVGHSFSGTSLLGADYQRRPIPRERIQPDDSPCARAICGQHMLEPALWELARSYSGIRFASGTSVLSLHRENELTVARCTSGSESGQIALRAPIAILADGAQSTLRRSLGIRVIDTLQFSRSVSIIFECNLASVISERPSLLYKIGNALVTGAILHIDRADTWMLMSDNVADGDDQEEYYDRAVAGALGPGHPPFRVLAIQHWRPAARVTDRFRWHDIFLAGDVAHVTLPISGLGMNCGLQDAYNLAWKIALYLQGQVGRPVLDSYEAERIPVAVSTVAESVRQTLKQRRDWVPEIIQDYRYMSEVIISDTSLGAGANGSKDARGICGRRVPHLWTDVDQSRSTLDLLRYGFSLMCWRRSPRIDSVVSEMQRHIPGIRVIELRGSVPGSQADALFGTDGSGFMVVRPDRHIAWHATGSPATPPSQDACAVEQVLGWHQLPRRTGRSITTGSLKTDIDSYLSIC